LNKCRGNQECSSFNYNKLTKWCYLGTTEEIYLRQTRNSKWAAGVRRCVEHIGNAPWNNDEFSGGAEGTAPVAPTGLQLIDATQAGGQNSINWSVTWGTTAGTTADGSPSAIAAFRLTCTATSAGSSTYPTVVKTYTKASVDANGFCTGVASTTLVGCNLNGLSITTYSCSIVTINTEGLESPAFTPASVTVV
jgi:hypothetical protein